jgi:hypothetical protein
MERFSNLKHVLLTPWQIEGRNKNVLGNSSISQEKRMHTHIQAQTEHNCASGALLCDNLFTLRVLKILFVYKTGNTSVSTHESVFLKCQ